MTRLVVSPRARQDLDRIFADIATVAPNAAARTVGAIEAKLRMLREQPFAGRTRPDVAPGLRHWPVPPYIVLYRVDAEEVRIVRVLHGRRSLPDLL